MENEKGLYNKYIITKSDGSPVNGEYFVLRLDPAGEQSHVKASLAAINVYADMIAEHNPKLSDDLKNRYPHESVIADLQKQLKDAREENNRLGVKFDKEVERGKNVMPMN